MEKDGIGLSLVGCASMRKTQVLNQNPFPTISNMSEIILEVAGTTCLVFGRSSEVGARECTHITIFLPLFQTMDPVTTPQNDEFVFSVANWCVMAAPARQTRTPPRPFCLAEPAGWMLRMEPQLVTKRFPSHGCNPHDLGRTKHYLAQPPLFMTIFYKLLQDP